MTVSAVLLYFTLAVCSLLIGWLVVRYDLHEREPLHMLVLATALGAGAMFAAGQAQVAAAVWLHGRGQPVGNGEMALLAGVTEEIAKLAVVAVIALGSRRFFNEPIDGLIYGSFAGLGAALEESVAVLSDGALGAVLPAQEPVRLAGHLVMGGIGGFGVGLVLVHTRRAAVGIALCLVGAMGLHVLWDVVAFDAADVYEADGRVRPWHTGSAIGIMLGGMVVYRNMVAVGGRLTQAMLKGMKDEG